MYEYTDRVIRYLNKRFIRMFHNAKSKLLPMDELNILNYSKDLYDNLENLVETYFLKIAKKIYKETAKKSKTKIDKKWLHKKLSDYDPITMYVYLHEVDRKRGRFEESVIASYDRASEVEKALRYWSRMVSQYAIEITDEALIDAYKDNGVKKVIWITAKDEKVCKECDGMDRKVYDIDKIPPKPHINCRCILLPYTEVKK